MNANRVKENKERILREIAEKEKIIHNNQHINQIKIVESKSINDLSDSINVFLHAKSDIIKFLNTDIKLISRGKEDKYIGYIIYTVARKNLSEV